MVNNKKAHERFGTDGDQVKQIIQHIEAEERQASRSNSNAEFGNETDIKKMNQKIRQVKNNK
ncbi:hypothetical protein H9635_08130 [Solibacillus sp. A46]|uniref:Small, acid-soluble spore protein gamma-type n=1 Tax=Solibacillus faecavium TaxID=2762221 RepID=A0ABR8XXM1_9BACL|nr:hypothetical protein [Solibacillus faecavium]MBD8036707.1 hypothetical protein [Solibacillus faecavium]